MKLAQKYLQNCGQSFWDRGNIFYVKVHLNMFMLNTKLLPKVIARKTNNIFRHNQNDGVAMNRP